MAKERDECYICGRYDYLHCHHVFEGANRQASERFGLTVNLCPHCHRYIHSGYAKDMRRELHKEFQKVFELDHTREEFIENFTCGSFL